MSEQISLARPYARAVFELARDSGEYAQWSSELEFLANVTAAPDIISLINNPEVSKAQQVELILDVGKNQLSEQGCNLVKLLAYNNRLPVTVDINQQYLVLRDEAEQIIEAQLITAADVDQEQKQRIEAALSSRLGKKIKLEASVDESLIGGAVVRAGDWVVDGSVKAQLHDLVSVIGS